MPRNGRFWWFAAPLPLILAAVLFALLPTQPRWTVRSDRTFFVVDFSRDGTFVRTWGWNDAGEVQVQGPLDLYDAGTGAKIRTLLADFGRVASFAYSPDDRLVAAVSPNGNVAVVELATGRVLWQRRVCNAGQAASLLFSPNAEYLSVCEPQNDASVLLSRTGAVVHKRNGYWDKAEFTADNQLFVAQFDEERVDSVHIWPLAGKDRSVIIGKTCLLTLSPDGNLLLVYERLLDGSPEHKVILWDLNRGVERIRWSVTSGEPRYAYFSPDQRVAAIVNERERDNETTAEFWDVSTGRRLGQSEAVSGTCRVAVRNGQWSSDGRFFALFLGEPLATHVFAAPSGQHLWDEQYTRMPRMCWADFIPDSQAVIVARQSRLEWRDAATGTVRGTVEHGVALEPQGEFSRDRRLLLVPGQVIQPGWDLGKLGAWLPSKPPWLQPGGYEIFRQVDANTSRELARVAVRSSAEHFVVEHFALSHDGNALLTIAFRDGPKMVHYLSCWDLPPPRPWGWILGPPLCLAVLLLAWDYAKKRRAAR